MKSTITAYLLTSMLLFLCPSSVSSQVMTSTVFPLHTFGTSNCNVVIEVDDSSLVPSLVKTRLSSMALAGIVPYVYTKQGQAELQELERHKELSLGDTRVYFYLAISAALDRIYRNLLLGQGGTERSASEKGYLKGLQKQFGEGLNLSLANLRDLAKVSPIRQKTLRLSIFLRKSEFDRASAKIGLHDTAAFWDPTQSRIGYFFDPTIFRWFKEHTGRQAENDEVAARRIRDYVTRQALGLISHETVHFIQRSEGDYLRDRPFLAEAAALLVQSNVSLREEISRLTHEQGIRGYGSLPESDSPCLLLMRLSPPAYFSSLQRLQQGIEAARRGFPLKRVLEMSDREFYEQAPTELRSQYAVAFAFALFTSSISRSEFTKALGPLLSTRRRMHNDDNSLTQLGDQFSKWAEVQAEQWWASPSAERVYENARKLTSLCIDREKQFILAYAGSELMYILKPHSPTPFIYSGDVLFNLNVPFVAFDYYKEADAIREEFGLGDETEVRLDSRLGDAFEIVGDIDGAQRWYGKLDQLQQSSISQEAAIPWLRSKIKYAFHRLALSGGYAHDEEALYLAISYVGEFQGTACGKGGQEAREKALLAVKQGDTTAFWAAVIAQYTSVIREMEIESDPNRLDSILKRREQYCKAAD